MRDLIESLGALIERRFPTMPRRSYLPKEVRDLPPEVPPGTDLEIWQWTDERSRPMAIAFAGKAQKPLWHYSFRSEQQRERRIKETVDSRLAHLKRKEQEKTEKRAYQHTFKEGDILYCSWGYEQTNINFYEVVEVKGKQVVIQEIQGKIVSSQPPSDKVAAVAGKYIGKAMRKTPQKGDSVKISAGMGWAHKWDGKPLYQTTPGWGH